MARVSREECGCDSMHVTSECSESTWWRVVRSHTWREPGVGLLEVNAA